MNSIRCWYRLHMNALLIFVFFFLKYLLFKVILSYLLVITYYHNTSKIFHLFIYRFLIYIFLMDRLFIQLFDEQNKIILLYYIFVCWKQTMCTNSSTTSFAYFSQFFRSIVRFIIRYPTNQYNIKYIRVFNSNRFCWKFLNSKIRQSLYHSLIISISLISLSLYHSSFQML